VVGRQPRETQRRLKLAWEVFEKKEMGMLVGAAINAVAQDHQDESLPESLREDDAMTLEETIRKAWKEFKGSFG
jgi:hypothetical protein